MEFCANCTEKKLDTNKGTVCLACVYPDSQYLTMKDIKKYYKLTTSEIAKHNKKLTQIMPDYEKFCSMTYLSHEIDNIEKIIYSSLDDEKRISTFDRCRERRRINTIKLKNIKEIEKYLEPLFPSILKLSVLYASDVHQLKYEYINLIGDCTESKNNIIDKLNNILIMDKLKKTMKTNLIQTVRDRYNIECIRQLSKLSLNNVHVKAFVNHILVSIFRLPEYYNFIDDWDNPLIVEKAQLLRCDIFDVFDTWVIRHVNNLCDSRWMNKKKDTFKTALFQQF
jgi:hypothetical protein